MATSDVTHEDVVYARPDGDPLLARVYRPVGVTEPLPALVDVHGGAWTHFDRTIDAYFDTALAASGMIVVALDFRQAPAHRFPTAVADVVAGVRWTRANAATLGVRPEAIGLIGGSSGGHLALLAALTPNAPAHTTMPLAGADGADARTAFVLALWPIADPIGRYRYLIDRVAHPRPPRDRFFQPERLIEGHELFFGDEATMTRASVPRLLAAGEAERVPPLWVAHPELDENVTLGMSTRLVEAYRNAGGTAELEVFPGVGHAFANIPGEAADRCIVRMRQFIERRLTP